MSIRCGRYTCRHCLGEECQAKNIQLNSNGECATYDSTFAKNNAPIVDLFEKDHFYVLEDDGIRRAWVKKIDRVLMLKNDKQPRIEADCEVSFPGSALRIPRRYTFCEQTINKTLFIGKDAEERANAAFNQRKEVHNNV